MIGNRRILHREISGIAQMDIIRDVWHAPDTFRVFSKNDIGALGIYIIGNGSHPRQHRKPLDESFFSGSRSPLIIRHTITSSVVNP